MRQLDTFKDVAAALREAEDKRVQGEIQQITGSWNDTHAIPMGFCAVGAIAYVAGMPLEEDGWWSPQFQTAWPIMAREVINPVDGEGNVLCLTLSNLHDIYDLDWLELADWLEGLKEPQE